MIRIPSSRWLFLALLATKVALFAPPLHAQDNRNLAISQKTMPDAMDRRVALIIGNSAYKSSPLKNPANDAADVAAKLRSLGFEVIEYDNLKTRQIGRALREFRSRLTSGSVALFFYAGHGLQIKGENYLPTVDADIEGEEDVPHQSIAVRQVMEVMEDAKTRMNLAFLDACRNNPYSRSFRSGGGGLAKISAPSGTLISFATRPGSVAADGDGRNGLYTTYLLSAMETPNQPVELMLKQVTSGVKRASRGSQEPWMEGSIEGNFYFRRIRQEPVLSAAEAEKARKEAIDEAVQEALRKNLDQSGRDREKQAEREAALKAERQIAIDRAVQEAVKRNNEQAAKERAELQASMQKLIEQTNARRNSANRESTQPVNGAASELRKQSQDMREQAELQATRQKLNELEQALARQNVQLEEQRKARADADALSHIDPEIAVGLPTVENPPPDERDVAVAIAMTPPNPFEGQVGSQLGDEWEYLVRDRLFGKNHKLVWRVKSLSYTGVVEELDMDKDRHFFEWFFDKEPLMIGIPSESGFFFAAHWQGDKLPILPVVGYGDCASRLKCKISARIAGNERITVPAGSFDAIRVDGQIISSNSTIGRVSFWYAANERRLLKQSVLARDAAGYTVDETIELHAIRIRTH